MSSPFATFRKNRRFWMALLTLLAVISFVVLPTIDQARQALQRDNSAAAVYVRWNGGRLTVGELQNAMSQRRQLMDFLEALAEKVIEKGGEPAVPFFSRAADGKITSLGIDTNVSPERIAFTRIIASKASQMGIEFDDLSADEYLKAYIDGQITDAEFNEILKSSTNGLTIFNIRELLKQELAFVVAQSVAVEGVNAMPPGKTWMDFLKLTQTVKVEAYPVEVNSFMDKVTGQPSESEIQALYDQGHQRPFDPNSFQPGFLRPEQANIEYIEFRFKDFVDREKAKLTEEEIRAEYDRMVSLGQLRVPENQPPKDPSDEQAAQPTADAPATDPAAPAESAPAAPSDPNEQSAATPASDTSDAQAPLNPQADAPASTDETPTEPSAPEAPQPAGDPQGAKLRKSAVRLVSLSQEESTPATDASASPEQPPASTSNSSDQPLAESPASVSTDQAPAAAPSTAEGEVPQATASTATVADSSPESDAEQGIATAEPTQPAMRTQTFEEAKDEVATSLARTKSSPIFEALDAQLKQLMRDFNLKYRQYVTLRNNSNGANVDLAMPSKPDLRKFAEDNQLKYGETGLSDRNQLAATPLGSSSLFREGRSLGNVANVIPSVSIELFEPMDSVYFSPEGSEYIQFCFWKIDSRPQSIPSLEEARGDVIAAWQRGKAQVLAETAAQEMSRKVGDPDDPWKSALAGMSRSLVITTDHFPWLTRMGNNIVPSTIPNLDRTGYEFMQRVFTTEVGRTGVAANNPKSIYYVYRVVERAPDMAELRQRFESDPTKQGAAMIANMELSNWGQTWLSRIITELDVQFSNDVSAL
ncbi:MAG: hypothetical protein KF752_12780 [Pirellulaceae bacterium]|nr:hypothetical protein [Pirellulaceae bacterium]